MTPRPLLALPLALVACAKPSPRPPAPTSARARLAITSEVELVARGIVSSEYSEVRLAASPDGRLLLWGSTDRPGGPGGWNIWASHRNGDAWGPPQAVSFNSDANDFDPAFSADGAFVYFFSNRPGGAGGDDLYRVRVAAESFGAVEHLPPEVNTAGDEWAPSPSPDGNVLLFATNVPGAKHDLHVARVRGDGFEPAAPLPGSINTPDAEEFDATFLADGTSIVYTRSPDLETGPIELHLATLGANGWEAGPELPASINGAAGIALGPSVGAADPSTLYFTGRRDAPAAGKLDIYRVSYTLGR